MKTKCILLLFLALFSISSFADVISNYCGFHGILTDKPGRSKEEEFAMLLEPQDHPNYEMISSAIGVVAITPINILKDSNCAISGYVKQLLEYYQKHKDEIKNYDPDTADILDLVQKKLDKK